MQEIYVEILPICKVGKKRLFNIHLHNKEKVIEMIFVLAPGVCADLKSLHGCGPGSQRETFIKKHCRKTCGLCSKFKNQTNLTESLQKAYSNLLYCLQSRPGNPNVVCESVCINVETKIRITRMTIKG